MKIGLLTFHRAINYGAILQTYSLYKILSELNNQVEVIDYYPKQDESDYNIFRSFSLIRNWVYNILVLPYSMKIKIKKNKFAEFQDQNISLSRRFLSYADLKQSNLQYDAIITGSDQVFNPVNEEKINTYYLNFVSNDIKKIAYAPSFGISNFTLELAKKIGPYFESFSSLSCREKDGSKFITETSGRSCPTVIDPVFLTSKDAWNNVAECKTIEGGYIFVYDLNGRERLIDLANKLKNKTGLPIVCLSTKKYFIKRYNVDFLILDAGPKDFLKYISEANYVLTDSFHGTSFSLIFRKRFLSCVALQKSSARLTSLLSSLKLQHHLVQLGDIDSFDLNIADEEYNCQTELQEQIDFSLAFLNKSLK